MPEEAQNREMITTGDTPFSFADCEPWQRGGKLEPGRCKFRYAGWQDASNEQNPNNVRFCFDIIAGEDGINEGRRYTETADVKNTKRMNYVMGLFFELGGGDAFTEQGDLRNEYLVGVEFEADLALGRPFTVDGVEQQRVELLSSTISDVVMPERKSKGRRGIRPK